MREVKCGTKDQKHKTSKQEEKEGPKIQKIINKAGILRLFIWSAQGKDKQLKPAKKVTEA